LLTPLNLVFVALIVAVAAFAIHLNRRLNRLYGKLRQDLQGFRVGAAAPWMEALVRDYIDAQQRRGVQPNAQLWVDRMLTSLTVDAFGLRLPVSGAERTLRFCGSIPVLLGLTGNFAGWMIALVHLRASWPSLGSGELGAHEMVSLLDALQQPLGGLSTAFTLSIGGLVASLFVNSYLYIRNAPSSRERLTAELEAYLEECSTGRGAPGDTQDLLVRVLDRFGQMASSIEQNVSYMMQSVSQVVVRVDATVATAGEMVGRMHPMASAMERAADAIQVMASRLESIVGRLEFASGSFAGGADTLEKGLESFGVGVHRLADAQDRSVRLLTDLQASTASTLGLLSERLAALERVEARLEEASSGTVQALQAMVAPVAASAAQLKEQYLSLERQTASMEVSVTKLRASGDRLEVAATALHESQDKFVGELEQNLMRANQTQLQQMLDALNDLNRCLTETQQNYMATMQSTVGTLVESLSHPVLEDLVKSLQRLVDEGPAIRAR